MSNRPNKEVNVEDGKDINRRIEELNNSLMKLNILEHPLLIVEICKEIKKLKEIQ
ncbi:MAG: hypothetical protein ABW174_10520 [Flavitalea sp.]